MKTDIWERHAIGMQRREELEQLDAWLLAHPWKARLYTMAFAFAIFAVSQIVRFAFEAIGGAR
jgi:hypothetical protein